MSGHELIQVAAVVVTYNRIGLLRECLEAIRNQSSPVLRLIVVDNASNDGTGAFLQELDWPFLTVIRLSRNLGGAGGFAEGIKQGMRTGATALWLMDDDCIPAPDALEQLLCASRTMNERGLAHSFLCSRAVDNDDVVCNHPVPSTARNVSGWPRWADVADTGCILVDECTFVSALVMSAAVRQVGLPISAMFIWGDDVEYTRRLSRLAPGIFVGRSRVVHKRALAGQLSIFTEKSPARVPLYRHFYRNRIYLYRHYFSSSRYLLYLMQVFGDLAGLVATLRFDRAAIVARGLWEGLVFSPHIEHPDQETAPDGSRGSQL